MSKYVIENYQPTQSDIELLVVSAKAADMQIGQLLRQRMGDEWRVPDMLAFKTMDGLEHQDRDWVGRYGDSYAARVVLTPAGLELLAEELIREVAACEEDGETPVFVGRCREKLASNAGRDLNS